MTPPGPLRERLGVAGFDGAVRAYAALVRALPQTDPRRHGVTVTADVPYLPGGHNDHRLDVYAPSDGAGVPLLYVHGGGFGRLSRRVYWLAALTLARAGFTVFALDHRRAPAHRYPAAHADVAAAALWVRDHAARYGADPARLVAAGDSTGANLVTSLALATSLRSDEPWARAVFDAGLALRAVAAACGLFEVTDPGRYLARADLAPWVRDAIAAVPRAYCAPDAGGAPRLVDPVVVLERAPRLDRPLPPFLLAVGGDDPIADDTRRLARALDRHGARHEVRVYDGGVHGFHYLLPWQARSRACWADHARFLSRHAAAAEGAASEQDGPRRAP